MKKNKDQIVNIVLILGVVAIIIVGILALTSNNPKGDNNKSESNKGVPNLQAKDTRYDFGEVPMSEGKVSHIFDITNTGGADLKVSDLYTSCMCTEARLIVDGKKGPKFGMPGHGTSSSFWSDSIAPGQTAQLEVIFDPNAHGPNGTGPIRRTVTVVSNNGGQRNMENSFTFSGVVVK